METTIFNLIKNAILYTPADSDITISAYISKTSSGHFEDDTKKIIIENNESLLVISISDNGIGMNEKVKERIFEPFFTTKDVGEGTGLGLSIVYNIIESHDGEIKVNTEEGNGTEFIITLPKSQINMN